MRIIVLRQQVAGPGGAETTLCYLVRGLAEAGHEVTVLGTQPVAEGRRALGSWAAYGAVPVWGGKTGRLLSYAWNAPRAARALKPEVVFSLERTLYQQVYRAGDGCHREWLARRRLVRSSLGRLAQTVSPFHQAVLWLEGRLFAAQGLRRVIANSQLVAEEVRRHYGVPRENLAVIYNGLDRDRFFPPKKVDRQEVRRRLGAEANERLVLFAGSGFARKGLAYLLAAFSRLKDGKAKLWVVGKGAVGRYRSLAARLGVGARVRFWGPVPEVAPFYQAADAVALPTLYDPCSNVVLEALACGCPVVTTTANGAAEFVFPPENGVLVTDPQDTPALAGALEELLARGRTAPVEEAAAGAVAALSWERTIRHTLEVLEAARQN